MNAHLVNLNHRLRREEHDLSGEAVDPRDQKMACDFSNLNVSLPSGCARFSDPGADLQLQIYDGSDEESCGKTSKG